MQPPFYSLSTYGTLARCGSLTQSGTLSLLDSLMIYGTLDRGGSFCDVGTLAPLGFFQRLRYTRA